MEYREIVSVTGLGGLYQLVATKSDGAVVRSLADGTAKFISARVHNVTPLESIEIYTTSTNVRLHEVLERMKADTPARPDVKKVDNDTIKGYFKTIFPEMDEDRVYVSDMKKMLKWFLLLQEKDLLHFESLAEEDADTTTAEDTSTAATEQEAITAADTEVVKPAKKTKTTKKSDPATADSPAPVKKTARKKKTEEDTSETKVSPLKTTAKKEKE